MATVTLYDILNVAQTASFDEIKAAYRFLTKIGHPDRNQSSKQAEEFLKRINATYQILSNPDLRKNYDVSLNAPVSPSDRDTLIAEMNEILQEERDRLVSKAANTCKKERKKANVIWGIVVVLTMLLSLGNGKNAETNQQATGTPQVTQVDPKVAVENAETNQQATKIPKVFQKDTESAPNTDLGANYSSEDSAKEYQRSLKVSEAKEKHFNNFAEVISRLRAASRYRTNPLHSVDDTSGCFVVDETNIDRVILHAIDGDFVVTMRQDVYCLIRSGEPVRHFEYAVALGNNKIIVIPARQ